MKSVILIPARLESTRFPNKPLALIKGKPMIEWVYKACEKSNATDVYVITDSQKIKDTVLDFGGEVVLTSSQPQNGTERCIEAINLLETQGFNYDVILNVQGDEPLIDVEDLNKLLDLFEYEDIEIGTLISPITEEADYHNPNVVKAVPTLFADGYCDIAYFSRAPIPYMEQFQANQSFKHIGVYAFSADIFNELENMEGTDLEEAERLEQLRWLQNHIILSAIVTRSKLIGVDTPEDLAAVEKLL